jgi:PAS domain S-box-containing protein
MLAGQAALALERLWLLETARTRALRLATLNEIGQAITSSLDLDQVLITLLDKVRLATGAEACSVALIEQASGDLVFRQAVGGVAESVIGLRLSPGQGLAGWVAQHRQSVLVPDAGADARTYSLHDLANFVTRDLVGVPLITRGVVVGVIELVNKRNGRFDEDDRRLLESVAAQAAIAIEHARLFETEHAGRAALATLYRVGQAVNSTLDADTILDLLTDEAMQATHATHGSALVARPDRGCFERRSLRGYSPEQATRALADWLPLDRGVNGRAYRTQQVVYVPDVQTDPDYHPLISETHSELAVPILRGGQVIGNLDLQSPVADAFRDVPLAFLQALTDQVAIALENARLFDETRRRVDEMSIVSQVALVGAAGRPFDETVARATGALTQLWPEASVGFWFIDEAAYELQAHRSYHGAPPEMVAALRIPTSTGLIGWAARERQPVRVGNVQADPRYIIIAPGTQSVMAAPLVAGDRVIGVVSVDSPRLDAFSGDDLRVLTTLAGQLATIFEKARLDAELAGYAVQLEQRVQERTAEIRREQARTQAILDALGEGVVVTDTQGTIQYMNRAMEQATGYTASESIGHNPRLWKSGQTPQAVYESMWATLLAGQTWRGEIVNRRKNGEFYFASLAAAPIPAAGESHSPLAGLVGVQRDITERKRAEEEMQRALEKEKELNTLKSNFVSLTSHEFRTPLTTILSSAEMLEHYGDGWPAERKLKHLHRIQSAVKHMTTLLNDILIIGKAEAGKLEFTPARLDLAKFCRDLMEEIQLTDKAGHTLLFSSQAECVQASMDEQLLRHILSNLLANALKYSPAGGVVQFDLDCQAGQAVLRIQDHGMGIPLEDQARLFETFHRASNARNIPGTGLGLAIVKRSVDLHGGTIDIASQVGEGTTVTVTLPLGEA